MKIMGRQFTMNEPLVASGMGGDDFEWHHAFASKGFPVLDVIMQKEGYRNNANSVNNKTTVFYYEVRIEQLYDDGHWQ